MSLLATTPASASAATSASAVSSVAGRPAARWAGAALVAAATVNVAAEAMVSSAWDRRSYSYVDDYVNFLGSPFAGVFEGVGISVEISSPLWWLMTTAWIVTGALIAAASVGLSRRLTGWRRRATLSLGLTEGLALILFAVFPLRPDTMTDGTLPLYLFGAFGSIIFGNALAITTGLSSRSLTLPRWLGTTSIALGTIGLINIPATYGWAPTGVAERISVYSYLLWAVLAGIVIARTRRTTR